MRMPESMASYMSANYNVIKKCELWDWREELPELAYLYGPPREVKAFCLLAEKAWWTLPFEAGITLTDGEPYDDWLKFVYLTLRQHLPSYFLAEGKLHAVCGFSKRFLGKEVVLPTDSTDPSFASKFSEGSQFFRTTQLQVDPFSASVVAIDAVPNRDSVRSVITVETNRIDLARDGRGSASQRDVEKTERLNSETQPLESGQKCGQEWIRFPEGSGIPQPHATQTEQATPSEVSGEAKYPGHVKKPYRTGKRRDPEREVVLEFVYDQYKSKSRAEVRQAAFKQFGRKHAPTDDEAVKTMAKEWANRFEPPLPWGKK